MSLARSLAFPLPAHARRCGLHSGAGVGVGLALAWWALATAACTAADQNEAFTFQLRSRRLIDADAGVWTPIWKTQRWEPSRTAVIVCDMWDSHHCYNAVQRVKEMAPRANRFLHAARTAGALIIHAPSECMEAYADAPQRLRAVETPPAKQLPAGIGQWCSQIPTEEVGQYPIDQSDGGEDDDPETHRRWAAELAGMGRNPRAPWQRQIDLIEIADQDVITDRGEEVWSLLEQRQIDHVLLLGVHTNMCVLGRPFGLRQLAKNGRQVALVRDLTDTMYNPARWPFVNHHSGTDLIVEHIEKFVCPTVESSELLDTPAHRYTDDPRPRVLVAVSEFEYDTWKTLPRFAEEQLRQDFKLEFAINREESRHDLPGLRQLPDCDVLLLSCWRRTPPPAELQLVRDHVAQGKAVVAIRTTHHAFVTRDGTTPEGAASWPTFDRDVLGASYQGHYGHPTDDAAPPAEISVAPAAADDPLLRGLGRIQFPVASWLYKMDDLEPTATLLLTGEARGGSRREPVAWTWQTPAGGRSFATTLGHPDDFALPEFQTLLRNAVYWAAGAAPPAHLAPRVAPPPHPRGS